MHIAPGSLGFFLQIINEPKGFSDIGAPVKKITHTNEVPFAKSPVVLRVDYFVGDQKVAKRPKSPFNVGYRQDFFNFGVLGIFNFVLGLELGLKVPFWIVGEAGTQSSGCPFVWPQWSQGWLLPSCPPCGFAGCKLCFCGKKDVVRRYLLYPFEEARE